MKLLAGYPFDVNFNYVNYEIMKLRFSKKMFCVAYRHYVGNSIVKCLNVIVCVFSNYYDFVQDI